MVTTGSSALRSTCRPRIVCGGQALGLGGAHVVLVEHLEHRGPGDPEDHRERDGAPARSTAGSGACSASQAASNSRVSSAVEHEEAGDAGGVEAGVLPAGRREPAQLWTAKQYLSRNARKNTGTATPISEPTIVRVVEDAARGAGRPGSPAGCRTPTAMIIAAMVSSMVAGKRVGEDVGDRRRRCTDRVAEVAGEHAAAGTCSTARRSAGRARAPRSAPRRRPGWPRSPRSAVDRAAGQRSQPDEQQQRQHEQHHRSAGAGAGR